MIVSTWGISIANLAIQSAIYKFLVATCYDPLEPCVDVSAPAYIIFHFIVFILVDVLCTILPFCLLWGLQMKVRVKLAASALLALASLFVRSCSKSSRGRP